MLGSFYSPKWQNYNSFFSLVHLPSNNVSLLMFDPPEFDEKNIIMKEVNLHNIFET